MLVCRLRVHEACLPLRNSCVGSSAWRAGSGNLAREGLPRGDLTPGSLGESGLRRRGGSVLVGSAPALLSISDQTSAVGGLAACVSGGREGRSHGGEAEHVSLQHIVRYLQYSLILPSAAPRVVCSSPIEEDDSMRMVTIRWGLRGRYNPGLRSVNLVPNEAGLQGTLREGHTWAVRPF